MEFPFKNITTSTLFLVLSEPEHQRLVNIELVRDVTGEGFRTIVITTNQPYSVLKRKYSDKGVQMDQVSFIDAITRYALGKEPEPVDDCRFISNPGNLTDMGIAVTEELKNVNGDRLCVVLDSVNSMLIYLSSKDIIRFIHFVANKLRLFEISGMFLAVEKGIDPAVLMQLRTFVDEVIEPDGTGPE